MAKPASTTSATAPWETPRRPSRKNFLKRLLPWTAIVALLALVAWGLRKQPIVVETGPATRSPLTLRVSEEGKTRVRNRYLVAAPATGKMQRVSLKPGDEVKAGETLLTTLEPATSPLLDPRARAQAEAAVSIREASRLQATASLEARRAALQMATADRDRMRSVTRAGTLSDSDRDRTEAEAAVKSAEVRAAEFSLQVADYELAQARAVLDPPASPSPSDLIQIKSPVSGRVLKVVQESESIITAGSPILEIGDPADIEIEAEILSRDATGIHPGDLVQVEQWGGETPLTGRVRRVEPAAFTKISALGVEEQRVIVLSDLVDLPNATRTLGDRYRVEVRIATWHTDEALVVPAGALFREGNVWKTYLFNAGTAKLTSLQVGHSDGRFTEILSGLNVGDRVLLHPPDTIQDGTPLTERQKAQ
jgi:HlyD family secretion protein